MALIIEDRVLQSVKMTGNELLMEVSCYLYQTKKLSFGKAKELAGLNLSDFQKELGKRNIDIHYTQKDLDKDLENLGIKI